jgi:ketosteroid isomerase-like protein
MSQENVEIVRRAMEAFERDGIQGLIEYAHPDGVFYPDPSWLEDREYRGRAAYLAFHKTQTDAFGDDFRADVREIRSVGDCVVVFTEVVGQAKGSGVPIRQQAAHVFSDFRDGMIGEDRSFLSWDAALKAVGLAE